MGTKFDQYNRDASVERGPGRGGKGADESFTLRKSYQCHVDPLACIHVACSAAGRAAEASWHCAGAGAHFTFEGAVAAAHCIGESALKVTAPTSVYVRKTTMRQIRNSDSRPRGPKA